MALVVWLPKHLRECDRLGHIWHVLSSGLAVVCLVCHEAFALP